MDTTKATVQATLLDLLPGNPPALLYEKKTRYKDGNRLFTQKVIVPDTTLFQRLCNEVSKGDEIRVTVTTEWYEDYSVVYASVVELLNKASCEPVASAL